MLGIGQKTEFSDVLGSFPQAVQVEVSDIPACLYQTHGTLRALPPHPVTSHFLSDTLQTPLLQPIRMLYLELA